MNNLRKLRTLASKSQLQVSQAVGCSQPTYQRWEANKAEIPSARLPALAMALNTSVEAILNGEGRKEIIAPDPKGADDTEYFGEVAIHFAGGGRPLLISVSDRVRDQLTYDLQTKRDFVSFTSLSNQTVVVRKSAISDVYLTLHSNESYGPNPGDYPAIAPYRNSNSRDWAIVEAIVDEAGGDEDFDEDDVERVDAAISQVDGRHDHQGTDLVASLARDTIWQISRTGERRTERSIRPEDLHSGIYHLVRHGDERDPEEMIVLELFDLYRTAIVNQWAIDYMICPTHAFEAGDTES